MSSALLLGVISKVRTSRTNERTFIWHFTPSLPPQTKVWSTMGVMYGRWLCTLSLFFPTTCPNNVVCLIQGRFPECSASIAKWTRRQSPTVEEKCDSYFFPLLLLHCTLKGRRVERVAVIAYLAPSTWASKAIISQSISAMDPHACTSRLLILLGLDRDRVMTTCSDSFSSLLLSESAAARSVDSRAFFFFFFFYCRSHNESGPNPLPPIWKFFRLSAMCELLRWSLSSFSFFHLSFSLSVSFFAFFFSVFWAQNLPILWDWSIFVCLTAMYLPSTSNIQTKWSWQNPTS